MTGVVVVVVGGPRKRVRWTLKCRPHLTDKARFAHGRQLSGAPKSRHRLAGSGKDSYALSTGACNERPQILMRPTEILAAALGRSHGESRTKRSSMILNSGEAPALSCATRRAALSRVKLPVIWTAPPRIASLT